MNKLKVVWLCHFYNDRIEEIVKPRKRMPEMAPWISIGLEETKKRDDIELHVVVPHRWISNTKEFIDKNIHYHFFNPGIPFIGRHWPGIFSWDVYTDFRSNKRYVHKFIKKIVPDIIHLHGLENAYYSSTIEQFIDQYPTLVTVQGFVTLQIPKDKISKNIKKRVDVEINLLKKIKNFGIRTETMINEIKKYNPKANFFWHEYFLNIPRNNKNIKRKHDLFYDLIYFARISKEKGVEDLIKATGYLAKKFPNIKVAIIGGTNEKYLKYLKELTYQNGCLNNIDFLGFLPSQEDVYKILQKSKICVLPTYNDTIPGTIVESMFRKISVVSYRTGGIPYMNKNEEVILLANQGDINGLAANIEKLLLDKKLRKELAERAYHYAVRRWDNKKIMDDIIKIYNKILKYGDIES